MKKTPEELRVTNIHITIRQHEMFTKKAIEYKLKVSELIRRALDEYIENHWDKSKEQ